MTVYEFTMANGESFCVNLEEAMLDMDALQKEKWIKICDTDGRHKYVNISQIAYIKTI